MTIISDHQLKIRKMFNSEPDYQLMLRWLTDPQLLEFYEGGDKKFTLESIKAKYKPRILGQEKITPCIATLADDTPIGYLQYYELTQEQKNKFGLEPNSKSYGIDLFIGDAQSWGKGLGTRLLYLLVKYIFTILNADFVIIDPKVENERAIRSYEKVGFVKDKILRKEELHEGVYHDIWLMIIDKNRFNELLSNS